MTDPLEPLYLAWQPIASAGLPGTQRFYRALVPGGWAVTDALDGHLCFIPDPAHEWAPSSPVVAYHVGDNEYRTYSTQPAAPAKEPSR